MTLSTAVSPSTTPDSIASSEASSAAIESSNTLLHSCSAGPFHLSPVDDMNVDVYQAIEHQKKIRKKQFWMLLIVVVVIIIVLFSEGMIP